MKRGATSSSGDRRLRFREPGIPGFEALIELTRHNSVAGRATLAAVAEALFTTDAGSFSDRDRAVMREVLRDLVLNFERTLSRALAERLSESRGALQDLTAALIDETADIAYSVLCDSGVLAEADLIEVIRHRTQAHQLATTLRRRFAEFADTETRETDVMAALLKNADTVVSRGVMEYLIAESQRVDTFQNPRVLLRDLPFEMIETLYWSIAAALRAHLLANFNADCIVLDDTLEGTVTAILDEARADLDGPGPTELLIDEMVSRRKLTEALLVRLLRQGEVSLFEAAFTRVLRLPKRLALRLLYEPGGDGLAIGCKATGFTRDAFMAIYELIHRVGRTTREVTLDNAARLASFFDRVPQRTALAVVRHWRRNSDYLFAIKRVETRSR